MKALPFSRTYSSIAFHRSQLNLVFDCLTSLWLACMEQSIHIACPISLLATFGPVVVSVCRLLLCLKAAVTTSSSSPSLDTCDDRVQLSICAHLQATATATAATTCGALAHAQHPSSMQSDRLSLSLYLFLSLFAPSHSRASERLDNDTSESRWLTCLCESATGRVTDIRCLSLAQASRRRSDSIA